MRHGPVGVLRLSHAPSTRTSLHGHAASSTRDPAAVLRRRTRRGDAGVASRADRLPKPVVAGSLASGLRHGRPSSSPRGRRQRRRRRVLVQEGPGRADREHRGARHQLAVRDADTPHPRIAAMNRIRWSVIVARVRPGARCRRNAVRGRYPPHGAARSSSSPPSNPVSARSPRPSAPCYARGSYGQQA